MERRRSEEKEKGCKELRKWGPVKKTVGGKAEGYSRKGLKKKSKKGGGGSLLGEGTKGMTCSVTGKMRQECNEEMVQRGGEFGKKKKQTKMRKKVV